MQAMNASNPPIRPGGRAANALRPVKIETGVLKFAEGSALISVGDTRVLVAASVENRVPPVQEGHWRGLAHGRVLDAAAGHPHPYQP